MLAYTAYPLFHKVIRNLNRTVTTFSVLPCSLTTIIAKNIVPCTPSISQFSEFNLLFHFHPAGTVLRGTEQPRAKVFVIADFLNVNTYKNIARQLIPLL
jgi:hypothetical protein